MNPGSTILARQFTAHTIATALTLLRDLKGRECIVLFHDTVCDFSSVKLPMESRAGDLLILLARERITESVSNVYSWLLVFSKILKCNTGISMHLYWATVYYIWWMALKYQFYSSCKKRGHNSRRVQPPDANSAIGFRASIRKAENFANFLYYLIIFLPVMR